MNHFCGIGRIVKDLDLKYGQSGTAVLKFTLAINRQFKKEGEERQADFINCVAFGKTAEALTKFSSKGQQIGITGHIQTGSYDNKEGKKVYTTEIIIDSWYFADSKKSGGESQPSQRNSDSGGFNPGAEEDDELPF